MNKGFARSRSPLQARPGAAVIAELARERLGFQRLRPGQQPAAEALAAGRDVLAVLPTRTRLTMMRRYGEHTGCRRAFLLSYFGQDYPGPCGNCDNDLAHAQAPSADVPFAVGAHVVSERWGQGTVQRYDGDQTVTVLFDEHGYRELFLPVVLERGLLRLAPE